MENLPKSTGPQRAEQPLSRGEFIRSLGMSSAALMAFYCMGTLTSCSGSGSDPAPVVIPPPITPGGNSGVTGNASAAAGPIDFTIDLTNTNFSRLRTAGEFVNVGEIIVFNSAGNILALGRICTHAGGELSFRGNSNDLLCNIHGGVFNTNGTVKQSPPTRAVASFTTAVTGDNLRVRA